MLRVIIFCDICNQQGIRYIEQKRNIERGDVDGRRITDGRSWFEGSLEEALDAGWDYNNGSHTCPRCIEKRSND